MGVEKRLGNMVRELAELLSVNEIGLFYVYSFCEALS